MSFDPLIIVSTRFADVEIVGNSGVNDGKYTPVRIPRRARFALIETIGPGMGGAGGCGKTAAGAAGGGGGGGSSGGYAIKLVPVIALGENVLYVSVPAGGKGGAGGSAGSGASAGAWTGRTQVTLTPRVGAASLGMTIVASSSNASPTLATGGTATAAGAGGTALAVFAEGTSVIFSLGIITAVQGQVGAAGGVQTGAVGASVPVTRHLTAGAGGAGCTTTEFVGGGITNPAGSAIPLLAGGAVAGGNGPNGAVWGNSSFYQGGAGGGSSNAVTGGRGGDGAMGCGGGGGGAGVTVGGAGGDGGPGRVRIWWL